MAWTQTLDLVWRTLPALLSTDVESCKCCYNVSRVLQMSHCLPCTTSPRTAGIGCGQYLHAFTCWVPTVPFLSRTSSCITAKVVGGKRKTNLMPKIEIIPSSVGGKFLVCEKQSFARFWIHLSEAIFPLAVFGCWCNPLFSCVPGHTFRQLFDSTTRWYRPWIHHLAGGRKCQSTCSWLVSTCQWHLGKWSKKKNKLFDPVSSWFSQSFSQKTFTSMCSRQQEERYNLAPDVVLNTW